MSPVGGDREIWSLILRLWLKDLRQIWLGPAWSELIRLFQDALLWSCLAQSSTPGYWWEIPVDRSPAHLGTAIKLFLFLPSQVVPCPLNTLTEDIYTNGSATLGSPAHANGREVRKMRFIQFEKATEEPMVSWWGEKEFLKAWGSVDRVGLSCLSI